MRREEEAAFEAYVNDTQRAWLGRAYRLCYDQDEAQDLVQHCWEKLFLNWNKVSSQGGPGAWMSTTMHHKFLDSRRSSRFKREFAREELPETPVQDSFVDDYLGKDSLLAAWALLTREERSVIDLRVFDGLTMSEIAHTLDTSLSTVNRRFQAARHKLGMHYQAQSDDE